MKKSKLWFFLLICFILSLSIGLFFIVRKNITPEKKFSILKLNHKPIEEGIEILDEEKSILRITGRFVSKIQKENNFNTAIVEVKEQKIKLIFDEINTPIVAFLTKNNEIYGYKKIWKGYQASELNSYIQKNTPFIAYVFFPYKIKNNEIDEKKSYIDFLSSAQKDYFKNNKNKFKETFYLLKKGVKSFFLKSLGFVSSIFIKIE